MKRKRIIILASLFIIGFIIGLAINYLNNKANALSVDDVNSKVISYMKENSNELPNYSYNYIDEDKNVVVIGLKQNNKSTQESFYEKIFTSSEIKKIKRQKLIVFEQGDVKNNSYERIIKVDDKLYYDTGATSEEARCGVMDGKITSHVENNQVPTKNDQSNFDGNFSYQYGSGNTIEVLINGEWTIFKTKE